MSDLNRFASNATTSQLEEAVSIDDSGRITVKGISNGEGAEFDLVTGSAAGSYSAAVGSGMTGQDVHMAIEALGHVGGDEGKKAIRVWLKSNPSGELRIMMAAMRSLGYLRDREAVPDLVAIMNANLNKRGKGGWGEGGFGQKPT